MAQFNSQCVELVKTKEEPVAQNPGQCGSLRLLAYAKGAGSVLLLCFKVVLHHIY